MTKFVVWKLSTKKQSIVFYYCFPLLISERSLWDDLMSRISTIMSSAGGSSAQLLINRRSQQPALLQVDYPNIQYWHESQYTKSKKDTSGDTLVGHTRRVRGRPRRSDDDETGVAESYPWLEDADGQPMSQKRLEEASRVLYRAVNALSKAEMAPDSWKKASSDAYDYVHSELSHLIEF